MMSETFICTTPSSCSYQVLIVHTSEAEEWAIYLQNVLSSSGKFSDESILLYPVNANVSLQEHECAVFNTSSCIVLLLSMEFLDMHSNPEVTEMFKKVFYPPEKMVLLFCGVSESEALSEHFGYWQNWRKLYTDDDPAIYISTVLESISEGGNGMTEKEIETNGGDRRLMTGTEECEPSVRVQQRPEAMELPQQDCLDKQDVQTSAIISDHDVCLAVQPDRILCGTEVTVYILLKCKLDTQVQTVVEFSSEELGVKREAGTIENEYTVSARSPDMRSGSVLVTLYSNGLVVCSKPVTYFTGMEEVSSYLESITNPLEFFSQAFNITSNCRESLDKLLADLLQSRMPASGFQIFGISQLEEENMSAYQRNEELPTLLHFAAKHGLQKLMTILLQCPGALQAYSVVNKHGDYPNNIAEKNGFLDLRQYMDEYVETADILKCTLTRSISEEENEDVYELMSTKSQDSLIKYSLNPECTEDIYERMMALNPDCMQEIYEDMEKALKESLNPEEAMLRSFFQVGTTSKMDDYFNAEEETNNDKTEEGNENAASEEEEEDPYNFCISDEIYDTVDDSTTNHITDIISRPPAAPPRPSAATETEENQTYISRVFSEKSLVQSQNKHPPEKLVAGPVPDNMPKTTYDPYAGMKTPGQRQLISLQERVKVGDISVEEAVQEFREWQMNQEKRSLSLRFQQENLKRLRDSIIRRQKEKVKMGKETEMEITAPLQHSPWQDKSMKLECAVYEPSPQAIAHSAEPIQRGTWPSDSSSSKSSTRNKRLSTHSVGSYTSRPQNDYEESFESSFAPSLPPRNAEIPPLLPPPRIPPRQPERLSEGMASDGYTFRPAHIQRPSRRSNSPPPIPRRTR